MRKNRQTLTIKRLLCVLLSGLVVLSPFDVRASTWSPTVLVNTESFQIMDDGDSTTDVELRFGGTLNEILEFDRTNSRFHFTDDLLVDGTLSASGTVFFEGTLTGATVFHGPFTSDCDDTTNSKLLWDSTTGKFSCGTDQTGAGGMTQAQGDVRYVNVHGDTMTGSLQIRSGSGVKAVGLEVTGTMSGRALVIQGTASGSIPLLTATGTTNRVGILTGRTNPPETELDVVGTISGTMLRVSSGASIFGGLTASGTVRFDGDILRLNDDQTAADTVLVFGSDSTNETLTWANIGDRFELSDDIATTGSLNASGALLTDTGAKLNFDRDSNDVALTFGSDTANESITWYNTADLFEFSDDLEVNGSMSGITLTISSLKGCDTLDTNGNGLLACGTDDGGGGGISQAQGDARFVNVHGDTMTGTLRIRSGSGLDAVNLNVFGTMSGGALVVRGSSAAPLLTATGATNRVGILTARNNPPEVELDVVGTISGSIVRGSKALSSSGTLSVDGNTRFRNVNYIWPTNGTNGSGRVLTVSGANAGNQLKWSDPPIVRIQSGTGAAGGFITWQNLAANSVTCTAAALCGTVMTTTNVGIGTWKFKYTLIYQTAATTTGISYGINHTGTTGLFKARWTHITTGTSAVSGIGDSDAGAAEVYEGYQDDDENAIIGVASLGVDAANTNVIAELEGIIVVTAAGTGRLELKMGSEVAGSAVKIMADSTLELMKIK